MGQRFQTVFILPPVFMNDNNPNNRNERALIYHNQWLYGFSALDTNLSIMQRLKTAIKKLKSNGAYSQNKKDYTNHFLEKDLNNAIKWASVKDLGSETLFHEPDSFEMGKEIKLSDAMLNQDNNNGFFICKVSSNLVLSYSFISGLEDTPRYMLKTPEEYLRLFYDEKQIKKNKFKRDVNKVFQEFKEFNIIDPSEIDTITQQMNKDISK